MSATPERRSATSADGVVVAYDVCGVGEPAVVFVHGWSGRRQHWDAQVDPLSADHLVVRLDLAGHGESGSGRACWSVPAFADDVVAVVDELGLERMILVGHSLGGSVIIDAATRLGRRVLGLVGADTWSAIGVRAPAEVIEASILLPEMRADFAAGSAAFVALECGPSAPQELVRRITAEAVAMTPQIAVAILDEGIRRGPGELEAALAALSIPMRAISSETFRPKDPAVLARYGIESVVLLGTGHYLMIERPDAFNRELARALHGIGGR